MAVAAGAALAAILPAVVAPTARAQPGSAVPLVVQDDAELLNRTPDRVRRDLGVARDLGVGVVRLTASWSRIAPDPRSTTKPGGAFRAGVPSTYAPGAWDHLDVAVREARRAGLRVLVDVAFWAPRWAVDPASPDRDRPRLRPDPAEFRAFATAVARRYDGSATGSDGRPLPRVDLYATWNEPNHPAFLSPQWRREGTRFDAASADVYRAMHEAAAPAIREASPGATVLLGNLTSIGGRDGEAGVPPLRFLRRLACVDDALRPVTDGACRDFRPVTADGLAFHPYTRYVTPGTPAVGRDRVQLADQAKLQSLLRRLRDARRIVLDGAPGVPAPVWLTEYGYEAREDDPYQPFTRADQARFVGWSGYLAWRSPGVVSAAQFLIRDIDPAETGLSEDDRRRYRDWQSGVLDTHGAPKPAAGALALPFWPRIVGSGASRRLWVFAQVRRGVGPQTVAIQRWDDEDETWRPVALRACGTPRPGCGGPGDGDVFSGPLRTDPQGVAVRSGAAVPDPGDRLRLLWQQAPGSWLAGPPITVVADRPA
ncbi:cellulase family glycosylhydrolase [Patulibacter minatonensis]|uniref:cellulase family glycosylhydrolase n=1 Tax=Patulibacter minatonensis TaxID=298163 RepID=UPI0012F77372|nr:cellulase family glycosylhydrolase [Patulibacter minatonensis]